MADPQNLECLLTRVQAKGNGFVVGTVAEDRRVVPFALLRVRLRQPWESQTSDRHRTKP